MPALQCNSPDGRTSKAFLRLVQVAVGRSVLRRPDLLERLQQVRALVVVERLAEGEGAAVVPGLDGVEAEAGLVLAARRLRAGGHDDGRRHGRLARAVAQYPSSSPSSRANAGFTEGESRRVAEIATARVAAGERSGCSSRSSGLSWVQRHPNLLSVLFGTLLGVGVCWPFFGSRPLLLLDWVVGPHAHLPVSIYGLDGGLTTGVLGALGTVGLVHVLGEPATWLMVFAFFPLAALGVGRLVGGSVIGRIGAATITCVNPWVFNRLYAGDVILLLGFALLPFALTSALRDREGHDMSGALVCALWWAVLTALAPQFAWIYGIVVVIAAVALWAHRATARGRVRAVGAALEWLGVAMAGFVLMTLYVLVPDTLVPLPVKVTTRTLHLYATTGDPHLGLFVNVAGLYGFWRTGPGPTLPKDVVSGWPLFLLAMLLLVASGYWVAMRSREGGVDLQRRVSGWAVLACGIVGYLLALGAQGPTGAVFRWAYQRVPFFDVLREPQVVLMLTALMYAVGVGWGLDHVAKRSRSSMRSWVRPMMAASVGIVLPLAYTPTIFGGLAGQLSPSTLPHAYVRADRIVGRGDGQVLVLPWHLYESVPFAGERTIANLGPSLFTRPVISPDDVQLRGVETQTTTPRSHYVADLVDGEYSKSHFGAQVAPLGIEYIALQKVVNWVSYGWLAHESDLRVALDTSSLEVWRNLDYRGVGDRTSDFRPVVEVSPVAYRVGSGPPGTVTIDAAYEPGWRLDGVTGTPTAQGTIRFDIVTHAGGMAVFSPWGATRIAYTVSGAVAVLIAGVLLVTRRRGTRRRELDAGSIAR